MSKLAFFSKRRRGMTLIETLIVMAIIVILTGIAIGGMSSARDQANETATQSDLRTYTMALQQVVMAHPEIMKFTVMNDGTTKPNNAIETLVGYINSKMDEQWKFAVLPNATMSGGVATSTIKRDAWGNPFGLYIYLDDKATTYTDKTGTPLKESDSCIYIAIVSAGKNSTGGPVGYDGNNFDPSTRQISSAGAMVNNTDGVDDIGAIVRILNGDVYTATFGLDKTTLGSLKGIQWIYGVPSTSGGICYDFDAGAPKTASTAGSVDQYYDNLQIANSSLKLFGSWS